MTTTSATHLAAAGRWALVAALAVGLLVYVLAAADPGTFIADFVRITAALIGGFALNRVIYNLILAHRHRKDPPTMGDLTLTPADLLELVPLIAERNEDAVADFMAHRVHGRADAHFVISGLAASAAAVYQHLATRDDGNEPDYWGIDVGSNAPQALVQAAQLVTAHLNAEDTTVKGIMDAVLDAPREHSAGVCGAVLGLYAAALEELHHPEAEAGE